MASALSLALLLEEAKHISLSEQQVHDCGVKEVVRLESFHEKGYSYVPCSVRESRLI